MRIAGPSAFRAGVGVLRYGFSPAAMETWAVRLSRERRVSRISTGAAVRSRPHEVRVVHWAEHTLRAHPLPLHSVMDWVIRIGEAKQGPPRRPCTSYIRPDQRLFSLPPRCRHRILCRRLAACPILLLCCSAGVVRSCLLAGGATAALALLAWGPASLLTSAGPFPIWLSVFESMSSPP